MNEKGLIEQSNAAIKAALELYAADHGKLNDGDSFTTKLNNCVLTISLKDGSLDVQFDPDADVAVDTPYTLDMKLDIYEEENNSLTVPILMMKWTTINLKSRKALVGQPVVEREEKPPMAESPTT